MQSAALTNQESLTHPLEDSIFSNSDASMSTDYYNSDPLINSILQDTKHLAESINVTQNTPESNRRLASNAHKKKKTLEDFEILDKKSGELGRGTHSKVQLVKEKVSPNRLYAMKVVSKEDLRDQNNVERLKREVNIQKRLKHPNIVRLIYNFEDKKNAYLVLQYAKNGNLKSYLESKTKLSEGEAFLYFLEACLGLDYLHKKGIVHRDLNTENILIDESGNAMLSDFGLSVEDFQKRTTFCGTLDYIAPEMIQNLPHDKKVDIWALGIVLYELLHGFTPFKDLTYDSTVESFKQDIQFGSISDDAKDLIKSLLQINPADRPDFPTIFAHPWMNKQAKDNNDIKLMEHLERNLCIDKEGPIGFRKAQSSPLKPNKENLLEDEPPVEVYDSTMAANLEEVPGTSGDNIIVANPEMELVMLNGPLINSETTEDLETNKSDSLRIENIESEENNASPLKRNFSQLQNRGYTPVRKDLVEGQELRNKTPTTGSIRKRGLFKKKKQNKENMGFESESENVMEDKSPLGQKKMRSVSPAPARALGLNRAPNETMMEEVQLFRINPSALKSPEKTVENEVQNREEEGEDIKIIDLTESKDVLEVVDAGEEKGNKEAVWPIVTGNSEIQFEDLDKKLEAQDQNEEIERIMQNIETKDSTALENMFPAEPLKVKVWQNPIYEKSSVKVTLDDFIVENKIAETFAKHSNKVEIPTQEKKEESAASKRVEELDNYMKAHSIRPHESMKQRNYVSTTEVEALPVTLNDGPIVAQLPAILFETRPQITTQIRDMNNESGEKETKSKFLEPKDVSRLLSSFKEEDTQPVKIKRNKKRVVSLQEFETVSTKLQAKGLAPYNNSRLMQKTEVDLSQSNSVKSSKEAEGERLNLHLQELFNGDMPRGAVGHADNWIRENREDSGQFMFGKPKSLKKEELVRKEKEVPYVFERVEAVGKAQEEKEEVGEFESQRNLMLSDYKNKLNNLTSIKKLKENKQTDSENEEEIVSGVMKKSILKRPGSIDSGKKISKALTFEGQDNVGKELMGQDDETVNRRFQRKKAKGAHTDNPKSFKKFGKEFRRKNEKLESLFKDIDYDNERVSRPSMKNPAYIVDQVPKKEHPKEQGFLSKVMTMLGCVDREEQQHLLTKKDIRDVGFSFKELRK